MSSPITNIHFGFEGHYSKTRDDYEWIPREARLYGISFKTSSIEEITYSLLVDRIRRKISIDDSTKRLNLSYIPLVVKPQRQSYIFDDENVYVYLTSVDKEQRRSLLHVEVVTDLEIFPITEQLLRVERGKRDGGSYGELISSAWDNIWVINAGDPTHVTGEELAEQPHEHTEPLENVAIGDGDIVQYDNMHDMDMVESVELPRVVEETRRLDEWEDGLGFEIGQEFKCKEDVQYLVDKAANLNCYGILIGNSDKSRYVVKCREAKQGCKWQLRAAKIKNSTMFSVRTYTKMHSCSRTSTSGISNKRKGTPRLVASVLNEDYPGNFDTPCPKTIVQLVQRRAGVEVSYSTTFRGKNLAVSDIRGSPVDGFKMLPSYLHMLEKVNQGTKTDLVLDEERRFRYLFVALGASIEGFVAMRKVLIVDATFIKNVYGGCLIFATAQDPNHHHYPIAFALVDGEKEESWMWFFNTLKTVIPDSRELVFISDRNASLIKAIALVYPLSDHGYCIYHLSQNVRGAVSYENKEEVGKKFREIARIYSESDFLRQYGDYRNIYPQAAEYLNKSVEVKKWARCYSPGSRYNIDTSNCMESMNAVFKMARRYHLLPMIDALIGKFSEWFNSHRKDSVSGSSARKLVSVVELALHARIVKAAKLTTFELNAFELEYSVVGDDGITYMVDLRHNKCSCRLFEIDRYPCVHAITATTKFLKQDIRPTELKDLYGLCSRYYMIELWALAYTRTIFPVPHMSEWIIPEEVEKLYAFPPNYVKRKGRVQETRYTSIGEHGRRRSKRKARKNLESWFNCSNGSQTEVSQEGI